MSKRPLKKTLIAGATIVNEGRMQEADVLISGRHIERIDSQITGDDNTQVIDAQGLHLLPGMIDDQVHFREPGLTHKGWIASESRAAVAGGVTSWMEMPNTKPPTIDQAALDDKYAIAARGSLSNYSFYLGATNDNLDAIVRADPTTTPGVKVFMGSSTGNMLVDRRPTLEGIFRDSPVRVITHCEDTPTIAANIKAAREKYGDDIPIEEHPHIRSREACLKSSTLATDLARQFGTRLHVLHLTTADELALFDVGDVTDKRITVEVCAHHLYFDESRYADKGSLIKCNPAIKAAEDRKALLQAVEEDRIDVIATDHAPHTLEEKAGNYLTAPAGLPLVQFVLPCLLELVHRGDLRLETVVRKTSHDVARLFAIPDRGFVREGYYADLTLVNLSGAQTVAREDNISACGWSPFEGETLHGIVHATWVNGHLVYDQGEVIDAPAAMPLSFAPE